MLGDGMKKNGFTLTELLAVIAILALLLVIATPNILNQLNKQEQKLSEETIKELKDSAVSYYYNSYFKKCSNGFEPTSVNSKDVLGCTKKVTVKELKDEGTFRDDGDYCDESKEILVYYYTNTSNGNDINELRAYTDNDGCYVE